MKCAFFVTSCVLVTQDTDTRGARIEAAPGASPDPRWAASDSSGAAIRLHSAPVGTRRGRSILLAIALLSAAVTDSAGSKEPANGVALVDSCGTYVRMREGAESYRASLIERTQLCSNLLWTAAEDLKARALGPTDRLPTARRDYVRCETDPRQMGPHQSVRVAYRYLSEHPEQLHLPAEQLAREALRSAFGCTVASDD